MKPTERQLQILMAIVKEYINTGAPVGSKALSEALPFSVSSATIRNEMGELIGQGYLIQPHTSAGRIPSVKGFKLYVNGLASGKLDKKDKSMIDNMLPEADDPEKLLENAGRALAAITNYAAVMTTPSDGDVSLIRVDTVQLGSRTGLIILLTSAGAVRNKVYRLSCDITPELQQAFMNVVKEWFIGKRLSDISMSYVQTVSASLPLDIMMAAPMLVALAQAASEAGTSHVKMNGGDHLLYEFNGEQARSIFEFLRSEEDMLSLLKTAGDEVGVIFGDDTGRNELKTSSVVVKKYNFGKSAAGSLGIIGPLRMDYEKLIPKIDYFTKIFENRIKEVFSKYFEE